jgi:DNA-directed RNA polymerase subunit RPC12/RpoP
MIEVEFFCRKCGQRFKARIFEKGEAEATRRPSGPVKCPNCQSLSVERR